VENNGDRDHSILLTFDVEDWFQVENFKSCIPLSSWESRELRVEGNTHRILDLLEGMSFAAAPKATFFVLGWIAERLPGLVREIRSRGHEVASHGFNHTLCHQEEEELLRNDLLRSKHLLEDILGEAVSGYRAPSFSVDHRVLETIESCGYLYDSSFNSFGMHDRYGHLNLAGRRRKGILTALSDSFFELPVSNIEWGRHVIPWGGGGYFRLLPAGLFRRGVRAILRRERAYVFYLHPWEVDPGQPRVTASSPLYRFRHYVNLDKTLNKLASFLEAFSEARFPTCRDYVEAIGWLSDTARIS
jgi:polysaccharide deacetylase family protein (PEP-CTERM system associated)